MPYQKSNFVHCFGKSSLTDKLLIFQENFVRDISGLGHLLERVKLFGAQGSPIDDFWPWHDIPFWGGYSKYTLRGRGGGGGIPASRRSCLA